MEGLPEELCSTQGQHSKHREMLRASAEGGQQHTRGSSPANAKMSNTTISQGFSQEKPAGSGKGPFLCPSFASPDADLIWVLQMKGRRKEGEEPLTDLLTEYLLK